MLASCGRVVSSVKKPKLPEKCFGLMVVDVCACGPGQQQVFWAGGEVGPAARCCSVNNFSPVEWDRCSKAFHQPLAPKNRRDSFLEERLSE